MSTAISHMPQRVETMESDKPNFAKQYRVDKVIDEVAFVLERIDKKLPKT